MTEKALNRDAADLQGPTRTPTRARRDVSGGGSPNGSPFRIQWSSRKKGHIVLCDDSPSGGGGAAAGAASGNARAAGPSSPDASSYYYHHYQRKYGLPAARLPEPPTPPRDCSCVLWRGSAPPSPPACSPIAPRAATAVDRTAATGELGSLRDVSYEDASGGAFAPTPPLSSSSSASCGARGDRGLTSDILNEAAPAAGAGGGGGGARGPLRRRQPPSRASVDATDADAADDGVCERPGCREAASRQRLVIVELDAMLTAAEEMMDGMRLRIAQLEAENARWRAAAADREMGQREQSARAARLASQLNR